MAQVRNVSDDTLRVPHVGHRVVEPDELLDVPDRDFVDRTWATSTWKLVAPPASDFYDQSTADAIWFSTDDPFVSDAPAEPTKPPRTGRRRPGTNDGQEA